jgi:hypothetical protein
MRRRDSRLALAGTDGAITFKRAAPCVADARWRHRLKGVKNRYHLPSSRGVEQFTETRFCRHLSEKPITSGLLVARTPFFCPGEPAANGLFPWAGPLHPAIGRLARKASDQIQRWLPNNGHPVFGNGRCRVITGPLYKCWVNLFSNIAVFHLWPEIC